MPAKAKRSRSPIRLYFLIMTLTGVIGSLVSIGILLYSVAKNFIITDQEYVISERYYDLDQCSNPVLKPVYVQTTTSTVPPMATTQTTATVSQPTTENYVQPTDAEKAKCKEEKTAQLIQSRHATYKSDLLSSGTWTLLFVILLLIHYRKFLKKED